MKNNFFSRKRVVPFLCLLVTVGILFVGFGQTAYAMGTMGEPQTGQVERDTMINPPGSSDAETLGELNIDDNFTVSVTNSNGTISGALRILLILTAIALAPMLIICLTSFTRILIVLHFTRTAVNTQTAPPNQVLVGLALFLTFFIMSPTINNIYQNAFVPFDTGEITQEEALDAGLAPLREFMYGQTQRKDVNMFMQIAGLTWDGEDRDSIPTYVLIPSFMVSELRTAFIIGFMIYVPFLVIDMVVASVLMSMGMMMLPPSMISMPFKILLFVLADGWNLIIGNLVRSFY